MTDRETIRAFVVEEEKRVHFTAQLATCAHILAHIDSLSPPAEDPLVELVSFVEAEKAECDGPSDYDLGASASCKRILRRISELRGADDGN